MAEFAECHVSVLCFIREVVHSNVTEGGLTATGLKDHQGLFESLGRVNLLRQMKKGEIDDSSDGLRATTQAVGGYQTKCRVLSAGRFIPSFRG